MDRSNKFIDNLFSLAEAVAASVVVGVLGFAFSKVLVAYFPLNIECDAWGITPWAWFFYPLSIFMLIGFFWGIGKFKQSVERGTPILIILFIVVLVMWTMLGWIS